MTTEGYIGWLVRNGCTQDNDSWAHKQAEQDNQKKRVEKD